MLDQNQSSERSLSLAGGAQAGLLACGLFTTIGLFSPGLVLPQIERAFSATPHAELLTQLIGAIASFSFAIGAPIAGVLIARLGCRRVILPSLILFAISGTAPAILNDLWLILSTRVVLGLSLSGIFTGGLVGIGALPDDKRAQMFGWFSVVGGSAAILLFPVVGALGRFGWHLPFVVHLVALAVLPLAILLPRTLGVVAHRADPVAATAGRSLLSPAMLGLLVTAALLGMMMFIGPMYAPLYLSSLGVTDTRLLAIPVTLGSIASVFASGAYGSLHRKLGVNGVMAAGLIVSFCALTFAATAQTIPLFTVAIIFHSAMIAMLAPNVSAAALVYAPPEKGSQAIGLANGVMFGAQLLFPFLAAWIRSESSITGVFLAFGFCALAIALIVLARMTMTRRRPIAV